MEEEERQLLMTLAEEGLAVRDLLAVICTYLASQQPAHAESLARVLEGISAHPDVQPSPAFQLLSEQLAKHLRGDQDVRLYSLQARDPSESGREQLEALLKRLRR